MSYWNQQASQGFGADPFSMGYLGMGLSAWGAYNQAQDASRAAQMAQQSALNALYAQAGMYNPTVGLPLRPCPYCGRSKHKDGHKSCDGCGAPR